MITVSTSRIHYAPKLLTQKKSCKPFQIIFRRNNNRFLHIISIYESRRNCRTCFPGIPFHFKSGNNSIRFFNIINLLLLGCAPKIHINISAIIMIVLHTLTYKEVFPQCADILTHMQRIEIMNNCIADTIIIKIYFLTLFQFCTHITAQCGKSENNIALFQQVYIFLYGFGIRTNCLCQFVV